MSFQFITSINTIDRDAETRRKVRSHARRQKLTTDSSSEQATSAKSGSTSQKDRTSKFRLGTPITAKKATSKSWKKHASPTTSSGSNEDSSSTPSSGTSGDVSSHADPTSAITTTRSPGQVDMITHELGYMIIRELPPLSALPIQTTPMTETLFRYMICVCLSPKEKFVQKWFDRCGAPSYFTNYHSSFLAHSHSMNPGGDLIGFLTVDPAMTHAFMGFMAAMHNALADWDDSSTIDFHRQETIQCINKRLNLEAKGHDVPVSDSVIVSVSLLVNTESFIGSVASARAHINGLVKMVELRGGLIDGLGHSPLLQRALSWADFAYATMAAAPLSFPLVPQIAGSLDIQDRFMSRSMMINNGATAGGQHRQHGRHNLFLLNRESVELFELLFSSTEAVNNFEFARLDELRDQRNQMSDTIYLLEYRLCMMEQQARARAAHLGGTNVAAVLANPTDLSESLIYASHLFLHLALRGQPPTAKRHKALTEALMTSLSGILVHMGWLFDVPSGAPSPPTSYTTDIPGAQPYDNVAGGLLSSSPNPGPITFDLSDMRATVKLETESEPTPAADDLHDDILLWIMFVGCCVQMRPQYARNEYDIPTLDSTFLARDHRAFFVLALRRLCRERAISGKEALIDRLRSIVWMNTWCERQLDMVWALLGLELGL